MDKLILKEFYNKILPAVSNNNLSIDGWRFNIEFQTIITDSLNGVQKDKYINNNVEETLIISNIELFNEILIKYVNKMYELIMNSHLKDIDYVYYNGNKRFIIDFILANLWNNVTDIDLQNPINYINNRIGFIDDPLYDHESKVVYLENLTIFDDSNIEYSIKLNNPILETPFSFNSYIVRDISNNEIYELPKIYYGINNDICYIYAIQGYAQKDKNNYTKKINRLLYKVGKNINDDYDLDNIMDVSPSALVALTIFLKILKEHNIYKICVIDYMPIRYKAKQYTIGKNILKVKDKFLSEEEFVIFKNYSFNKQEIIQKNLTDKLIRNFRRLSNQLGCIDITSYPREVDSMMHINITNEVIYSDNILNQLYLEEPKYINQKHI